MVLAGNLPRAIWHCTSAKFIFICTAVSTVSALLSNAQKPNCTAIHFTNVSAVRCSPSTAESWSICSAMFRYFFCTEEYWHRTEAFTAAFMGKPTQLNLQRNNTALQKSAVSYIEGSSLDSSINFWILLFFGQKEWLFEAEYPSDIWSEWRIEKRQKGKKD